MTKFCNILLAILYLLNNILSVFYFLFYIEIYLFLCCNNSSVEQHSGDSAIHSCVSLSQPPAFRLPYNDAGSISYNMVLYYKNAVEQILSALSQNGKLQTTSYRELMFSWGQMHVIYHLFILTASAFLCFRL